MPRILPSLLAMGLLATALPAVAGYSIDKPAKLRTVVTTDMEQDDLASLIRFLLYTNDLDVQGLLYTSSVWHWAGNGNGTDLRWTGTRTIQDDVLAAYDRVYPNLARHDSAYPTHDELLSKVKVGNIDFEGQMSEDSEGSELIRSLLLDNDPRPLYLQAWGGINTIARALKSIEERHSASPQWTKIKHDVSRKAVILASGLQDNVYEKYIAPTWPDVRVEQLSAGYSAWGYNCNNGQGNTRGLPAYHEYFTGAWTKKNIQIGPYGKLYRSWLDGQRMPGDAADIFGNLTEALTGWCQPLEPYDFLSEGDNVAYLPLLTTGIQDPTDPNLGGWGGRAARSDKTKNFWEMVSREKDANGTDVENYTTYRWMDAVQNDFAARMQWTVTPKHNDGNHPPSVQINKGRSIKGRRGCTVKLSGEVHDPDGDAVSTTWWQYLEEGTYPGTVEVHAHGDREATVVIPKDAKRGQTISIIFQGTDSGEFPLTRYERVLIEVQ